jgi:predicted DsbA family dithiol-disulfide isomerase
MKKMRVDVWSDIACPWCYLGKRRLEAALAGFVHKDAVEVVWRAFELDPRAPRERDSSVSHAERLAKKYGQTVARAEAMIAHMTNVAKSEGLDFHFERVHAGNTFDAHRVLHLAATRGLQDAVKERFMRAYFSEGEPIGEPETLVRLAAEAGLPDEDVRAVLGSDAHASDVRADEQEAQELGIGGVPFFVIAGRYGISGAQPASVLLEALTQAWDELAAAPAAPDAGEVCGPDGCNT